MGKETVAPAGVWWGRAKENGIWIATVSKRRLCWRGHDCLYVAFGRARLRLMKPDDELAARIRAELHAWAAAIDPEPALHKIRQRIRSRHDAP